jgi:hypothetical protein
MRSSAGNAQHSDHDEQEPIGDDESQAGLTTANHIWSFKLGLLEVH